MQYRCKQYIEYIHLYNTKHEMKNYSHNPHASPLPFTFLAFACDSLLIWDDEIMTNYI